MHTSKDCYANLRKKEEMSKQSSVFFSVFDSILESIFTKSHPRGLLF